ncbi:MAG: DUF2726 domain-containing protein [Oscillospiraceae bacterium]
MPQELQSTIIESFMPLIYIAIFFFVLKQVYSIIKSKQTNKNKPNNKPQQNTELINIPADKDEDTNTTKSDSIDYTTGYMKKWLFTYNEKDAFLKLKTITDEIGLYLFAKVRLYDLVEPKSGISNWKTYQYKIQAKHVDFVICDKKLVARAVIELDDASHEEAARKERDIFVDKVLQNCGYKIYRVKNIDPEAIKNTLITDLLT